MVRSFVAALLALIAPIAEAQSVAAPAVNVGTPAVGILLPLSGPYRSFGESCLRGIRLALGALEGRFPVVRTVILDTRGEAAAAAANYQKLAADPGVVAILGPMLSPETDAVQPYATGVGLTTLNFSQRPVGLGGPLFRFTLTKEDQARVLAKHAVQDLGLRRWAALHPDDAYGREIAAEFRHWVESLGGRLVADVGYPAKKTDLQEEAKRLQAKIGWNASAAANPAPPLDGVFVPDSADRIGLVSSYLNFVDLGGLQLLGASGWNRPQTLLAATPSVVGGVFVDGFFLYSFRSEVRAFVDAFRDAYHSDPGTLEAYGYDAGALLRDLVAEGGIDRRAMLAMMRRPTSRRGATGETIITVDGRIEKGLFLMKVGEGTIDELEATAVRQPTGSPALWRRPEWDSRSMEERSGGR